MRLLVLIGFGALLSLCPRATLGGEIPTIALTHEGDCEIQGNYPASIILDVLYGPGAFPVQSASFALPVPDCLDYEPAAIYIDYNFANTTGDWRTGVTVNFGTCQTLPVRMMTLYFLFWSVEAIDCFYPVIPHEGSTSGEIELVDCDGQIRFAQGRHALFNWKGGAVTWTPPPPPSYPNPPHGASGVGIEAMLDWDWGQGALCPGILFGDIFYRMYFGTEPDPPLVNEWAFPRYEVGPLTPSTTYYWRAEARLGSGDLSSPVWSFTTTSSTAVQTTTWGAIKALYE